VYTNEKIDNDKDRFKKEHEESHITSLKRYVIANLPFLALNA
jgi:hypothetical protein